MDAQSFLAPYADITAQRRRALRILGLSEGASRPAVRRRFRQLARTLHPDHGGASETFRRVVNAYLVLTRADPRGYALGAAADAPASSGAHSPEDYWRWWLERFSP